MGRISATLYDDAMRTPHARMLPALASLLLAASALATEGEDEWTVAPYIWIAGFEGTVGGTGGNSDTGGEAKFDHLWENTGLAGAMVNLSWRRERWTVFGDWTYAHVESESPTRVPALYDSIEADVKGHVAQVFVGYDMLPGEGSHLDVFGGTRYYNLDLTVDFNGAAAPDASLHGDRDWFDAVAGVRWVTKFAGDWRAYMQGDVGTGGSNFSWQGFGAVGYDFSWGTLFGGYRHLDMDFDSGSYQLDIALSGPFIGAAFTF